MRLQQRRPSTDRWVVRNAEGVDVYLGRSAGRALAEVAADDMVRVYLNGRLIYPPPDRLPIAAREEE